MAPRRVFSTIALCAGYACATPTIDYPINAQVPPVARLSEPFSYTFSASTFSSASTITYTLTSGPTWLSLDSNTRTLSGTPSSSDVGPGTVTGVPIELTATDNTGAVTSNATLVISTNPAPTVNIPAASQLISFGSFSAPSTLLYHPSTAFSFQFDAETFLDNATGLGYYAVSLNNTPLPSWVEFDQETLSFSGRTPDYESLIQPPQIFGFRIVASDVVGFLGNSITFEIEVGVHLLAFTSEEFYINATIGSNISFTGLANSLLLDGLTASKSSLTSVSSQTPSWLTFDNSSFALSGEVPKGAIPSNITISATDIYGDVANTTIIIAPPSELFNTQIEGFNATAGKWFSTNLATYLQNSSDIEMTAQFTPVTAWLNFNTQNFTLSGQVPSSFTASKINIALTATSKSTMQEAAQSFGLAILAGTDQATSTKSTASSSTAHSTTTASASSTRVAGAIASEGLSRGVIAAIVVPIVLTFLALLACLCCCLARRRKAKRPTSPSKSEISAPTESKMQPQDEVQVRAISPIPHVRPPKKLELDTSSFLLIRNSFRNSRGFTNSPRGSIKRNPDGTLRRSQTEINSLSVNRDSNSSGNMFRSLSENALSKTESSWRSTQGSSSVQESAYPVIGSRRSSSNKLSSGNNYSVSRHYSNYSRKGHARRSTRMGSGSISYLRDSNMSLRPTTGNSILNLRDSNFSLAPLDDFSVLSKSSSVQQTPEFAYATGSKKREIDPTKRYSRWIPSMERRRSGIGHGVQNSYSSSSGGYAPGKRASIGHGQEWVSTSESSGHPQQAPLTRNSSGWHTASDGSGSNEKNRRGSSGSNMTENTDLLYPGDPRNMNIKQVARSPVVPPSIIYSESSRGSRPVSRRTTGSTPFFGGGSSVRTSKKKQRQVPEYLYDDSPTVPEEEAIASRRALERSIMQSLRRQSNEPRDSFGISYGDAREGTERLRSYIESCRGRTGTLGSLNSNLSRDSRFESAEPSTYSRERGASGNYPEEAESRGKEMAGAEWEDYLPEAYSEGSWAEHASPRRDSRGNIIEYGVDESPNIEEAATQAAVRPQFLSGSSDSNKMPEIAPNARVLRGSFRRPTSDDSKGQRITSQSVSSIEQEDYRAYI
ncbi:hypothetical protein BP5796_02376 [Coleophoma crateriformis]|uniref:Dystroglycan-type cadherin-like domain-containing protein n=1 Tax=Coleophoma crateriformis TaxID=565419 RepID=A0A3D8SYG5_9HELO|nr:hypothetical protein BP5796_02376 [Coleophoma crateriformis]